jgi:phosphoribosylanthranilate isomerase
VIPELQNQLKKLGVSESIDVVVDKVMLHDLQAVQLHGRISSIL